MTTAQGRSNLGAAPPNGLIEAAGPPALAAVAPAHWTMLTSSLVADALDQLGHRRQCLGPELKGLAVHQRFVGRAYPIRSIPAVDEDPQRPYEGLLRALDEMPYGYAVVFATGRSDTAGIWGELITTACMSRSIVGAVTDGLVRDTIQVLEARFPVFSRGTTPYDSRGRVDVVSHGQPVVIDEVAIHQGDLVVADADGVVVVPWDLVDRVSALVSSKKHRENEFRDALRSGSTISEAFAEFGIL